MLNSRAVPLRRRWSRHEIDITGHNRIRSICKLLSISPLAHVYKTHEAAIIFHDQIPAILSTFYGDHAPHIHVREHVKAIEARPGADSALMVQMGRRIDGGGAYVKKHTRGKLMGEFFTGAGV